MLHWIFFLHRNFCFGYFGPTLFTNYVAIIAYYVTKGLLLQKSFLNTYHACHSDYRTVSHYWVLLVYVALIRAVWADDGDRPLLLWRIFGAMAVSRQDLHGKHMAGPYSAFPVRLGSCHVLTMEFFPSHTRKHAGQCVSSFTISQLGV
jgi:hypothetical protein